CCRSPPGKRDFVKLRPRSRSRCCSSRNSPRRHAVPLRKVLRKKLRTDLRSAHRLRIFFNDPSTLLQTPMLRLKRNTSRIVATAPHHISERGLRGGSGNSSTCGCREGVHHEEGNRTRVGNAAPGSWVGRRGVGP